MLSLLYTIEKKKKRGKRRIFMEKWKIWLRKYKGYLACGVIAILSMVSILIQQWDRKQTLRVNQQEIVTNKGKIAIYMTGAVQNPGVYYVEENSRLTQALDICGGVLENADINALNLAQKLVDGDKIVVPEKKEKSVADQIAEEEEEKEEAREGKININTASQAELEDIPGVGPSTAKKIIEYRKKNSFQTIEDIMEVSGIGEAKFDTMKDSICVN